MVAEAEQKHLKSSIIKRWGKNFKHQCQSVHIHGSVILKAVILEDRMLIIYLFPK